MKEKADKSDGKSYRLKLTLFLRRLIEKQCPWIKKTLSGEKNLKDQGVNSLDFMQFIR